MPFTFISDPAHGWLAVTLPDLQAVNLTSVDFSRYSYRKGSQLFYLEEDCDAPKFIRAWEAKHGCNMVFNEVFNAATFIRSLPSIK